MRTYGYDWVIIEDADGKMIRGMRTIVNNLHTLSLAGVTQLWGTVQFYGERIHVQLVADDRWIGRTKQS